MLLTVGFRRAAAANAGLPLRLFTSEGRPDAIGRRQAVLLIESFRRFPIQDITSAIMMAALDARRLYRQRGTASSDSVLAAVAGQGMPFRRRRAPAAACRLL